MCGPLVDLSLTCLGLLGSISSTYLCTAFTPAAPQSVTTKSSSQYLFTLLGPTSVKAVCRMLMKLSPGEGELTNEYFMYKDVANFALM